MATPLTQIPFRKLITHYDPHDTPLPTMEILGETLAASPRTILPHNPVYWKDNTPFTAELQFLNTLAGSASPSFIFEDTTTKIQYRMFLSDFERFMKTTTLTNGRVAGTWIGVKRGTNYGIKLTT